MYNNLDDDIEIIYWGEDEEDDIVNSEKFKKRRRRGRLPEDFDLRKEAMNWLKLIVVAVILVVAINKLVIINARVPTGSMERTIHEKSRMIGSRLAYLFSEPERGDIIIFRFPDNMKENYVKRVIGLPGEYVEIRNGIVYIDDEPLEEDYTYFDDGIVDLKGDFAKTQVPEGCYFVLGDNRNNSHDSRTWKTTHFVKENLILGKAMFSYYPKIYWLK
ncbi:MAG: signal peptidase I [Lachnospiraceae bacterium]|nr:signal peptidase I [Lachnospiraceae bacterium]